MTTEDRIRTAMRLLDEAQRLLRLTIEETAVAPDEAFLDCRLADVDFGKVYSGRAHNCFKNHERYIGNGRYEPEPIITVRDLISLSPAEVLREPNLGRKTLKAIEGVLAAHGLTLQGGPYSW